MRAIKLYGTGAATANAVANVQIPSATRIVGVQWAIAVDAVADNAVCNLEVSAASATEIGTNGAQMCISEFRSYNNLVTSGMTLNSYNFFVPVDFAVRQGQLIYLHANITTATYFATAILWMLK